MKKFNYCLAVFFFLLLHNSFALALPENHSVNGGLTIIPIDIKTEPEVYFLENRIPVIPSTNPNQWLLVVAIPLQNKDAIQNLYMKKPFNAAIPFQISNKYYAIQQLTIKDVSKVDPQEQDLRRIEQETKKLENIYATYSSANPFEQEFTAPLKGPVSSLFGLQRVYNHQTRDPHSGLDIAVPEGTVVHAVNQGKVIETGNYFYTGNTVIIDHGMGVFSLYAHLKKIEVQIGDKIKRGQPLGLVGKTGRVTGPHLHWTMVVNQTLVDPLLFVPLRIISIPPAPAVKSTDQEKIKTTPI